MGAPGTSGRERTQSKDGRGEERAEREGRPAPGRMPPAELEERLPVSGLTETMTDVRLVLYCWSQRRSKMPTGDLVRAERLILKPRPADDQALETLLISG